MFLLVDVFVYLSLALLGPTQRLDRDSEVRALSGLPSGALPSAPHRPGGGDGVDGVPVFRSRRRAASSIRRCSDLAVSR